MIMKAFLLFAALQLVAVHANPVGPPQPDAEVTCPSNIDV